MNKTFDFHEIQASKPYPIYEHERAKYDPEYAQRWAAWRLAHPEWTKYQSVNLYQQDE